MRLLNRIFAAGLSLLGLATATPPPIPEAVSLIPPWERPRHGSGHARRVNTPGAFGRCRLGATKARRRSIWFRKWAMGERLPA